MSKSTAACASADEPLVSVLMPVRNASKFIRPAIESMLSQTWWNLELIIIDDHSDDESIALAANYTDRRLQVLKCPANGVAACLNYGLANCRGDYIARMDADDISMPDRIKKQFAMLKRCPEVMLCGSQAFSIDKYGHVLGVIRKPISPEAIRRVIPFACPLLHPTYFARADFFRSLGGYRCISPGQDYDLLFRGVEAGYVYANLNSAELFYRVHDCGVSSRDLGVTISMLLSMQDAYRKRGLGKSGAAIANNAVDYSVPLANESPILRRLATWRNRLLMNRHKYGSIYRYLSLLLVAFLSVCHWELLRSSYRSFRAKLIILSERKLNA